MTKHGKVDARKKHISSCNGIHAIVTRHETCEKVSLVPKGKIKFGKQIRNACVHHVGGSGPARLTKKRKEAILKAHRAHHPNGNGKCTLHVINWKPKCIKGAM